MRRIVCSVLATLAAVVAAGAAAVAMWNPSALEEPGPMETWAATRAKRWLIGREARSIAAPVASEPSVRVGQMQYAAQCQSCHGIGGRAPTDIGRGMVPPAPDLGAPQVQAYSDAELFWIVKHGIRLTGMPGFGRTLGDDEIWPLVHYIRTLPASPESGAPPRP
jgi:Cytochrome c, mono- and diheme variants